MPIKDKVEPQAYCDVCGQDWAHVCCLCGGVFCPEHSVLVRISHLHKTTERLICANCLHGEATLLVKMIKTRRAPDSWRPKQYKETEEEIQDFLLEGESNG